MVVAIPVPFLGARREMLQARAVAPPSETGGRCPPNGQLTSSLMKRSTWSAKRQHQSAIAANFGSLAHTKVPHSAEPVWTLSTQGRLANSTLCHAMPCHASVAQ